MISASPARQTFVGNGRGVLRPRPGDRQHERRSMAGICCVLRGDVNSAYIAAAASGNAVDNNRQLHPEERTLAQRLAQQSGGRYTARQIEGNKNLGVPADTLVLWDVALQPGYNSDSGLRTQAAPGTTQVLEVGARPDREIQQFIVSSTTTGGVQGTPPRTPYAPSRGGSVPVDPPDAPTPKFANGNYYGAAGLDNTGPARGLISPEMRQAGGAERLGRQAGVIGAAATAASVVPGPRPGSAARWRASRVCWLEVT